jgi:hypothetical protein
MKHEPGGNEGRNWERKSKKESRQQSPAVTFR